jgi:hypothetical protein
MSRSNPPGSSIVARVRRSSAEGGQAPAKGRSLRRRLGIKLAALTLWLHIYVSMFGLAAVLFFSVTGITLNHPDWFFAKAKSSDQAEGAIDRSWLHREASSSSSGDEADPERQVDKLRVVEYLRATHGVRGTLAEFRVDEAECTVSFKGPGYDADAFIDRDTGRYQLTQSHQGFIAVINDLHKGRDTGKAWSVVIDVSAVVMTVISLTGLILLFYLKLRRVAGVVVILVGSAALAAAYLLWVP